MAFTDDDPLEVEMGVRCEDMNPQQLIAYIKSYHSAFQRNVAIDGHPERAVFRGMKRIYGDKTAGLIVKWVFYKYKGVHGDTVVTPLTFSKGRRWWIDKMHMEMQAHQRRESSRPANKPLAAAMGFATDL